MTMHTTLVDNVVTYPVVRLFDRSSNSGADGDVQVHDVTVYRTLVPYEQWMSLSYHNSKLEGGFSGVQF